MNVNVQGIWQGRDDKDVLCVFFSLGFFGLPSQIVTVLQTERFIFLCIVSLCASAGMVGALWLALMV